MKKYDFEFCMKWSCNECKRQRECREVIVYGKKIKSKRKGKKKAGERGGKV